MTKLPAQEIRDGSMKIAIWKNEGQNGPYYSTDLSRSYKEQNGEWHEKKVSFGDREILRAAHLLQLAHTARLKLLAADKKAQKEAGARDYDDNFPA